MSNHSSMPGESHRLIITIVKKGIASKVVAATKKAGVGGGTIFLGRGTANKKLYMQMFGIDYDPEKEVILTVVEQEKIDMALDLITKETHLDQPGKGVAFVINIKGLTGMAHLLASQLNW